jgi:hypothetical protein
MSSNPSPLQRPKPAPPFLALRPKDAAKALGIGERLLWDLTAPRGPIPCVRLGNAVTYPVHLLEKWLADQARQSLAENPLGSEASIAGVPTPKSENQPKGGGK